MTHGPAPAEHALGPAPVVPRQRPGALETHPIHDLLPVLIRAPRVDLRFVVPDELRRPALEALGVDPVRARVGEVFLLDSPALVLMSRGITLRVRRLRARTAEVTVSHRHLPPSRVPADVRAVESFAAQVDVIPEGFTCAATLRGTVDDATVRRVVHGREVVAELLTGAQHRFCASQDADPPDLDRLVLLGPLHVVRHKIRLPELDRPLEALHWYLPDGSRRVDLSARCGAEEAVDVTRAVKDTLAGRGLELAGDGETLIRRTLMHLAASVG